MKSQILGPGSGRDCGVTASRQWCLICAFCILKFVFPVVGSNPADIVSQSSDGSRAVPVHLIPLIAEPMPDANQGQEITPKDELILPFSTRQTCSVCHIYDHNYDKISKGWHFNAVDPNVIPGRRGQPWIFIDPLTATQIPLSYRAWPGTFRPEQVGISTFEFTQLFGSLTPGGGAGELEVKDPTWIARQIVSGKLEINCLSCHDADPAYDQAEYAAQVLSQNYRWAATAASAFASVSGSARQMPDTYDYTMPDVLSDQEKLALRPAVAYGACAFDSKNQVFFDIRREVPKQRCYSCHSNVNVDKDGLQKWTADEDVHLAAGMTCVDCHRNGLGHNITRGYEDEASVSSNPLAAASTCEGCHLGQKSGEPTAGRLSAPVPKHPGIPSIHFDKLTCTACHSGPWPASQTYRVKTSRAHALGTHNINRSPDILPHIFYPVFAKQADWIVRDISSAATPKIAPHKLIWPAFWGTLKDGRVTPIPILTARRAASRVILKEKLKDSGDWPDLSAEHIHAILNALSSDKTIDGTPVYIAGGKIWRLDNSTLTMVSGHPAAKPYMWPIAHDVRPAAQSLGVRNCQDCHATDAPFFFGNVAVDSPIVSDRSSLKTKTMVEFQDIDPIRAWIFAFSFVFRPWMKVVAIGAAAVLGVILLLFALKALASIVKVFSEQDQ